MGSRARPPYWAGATAGCLNPRRPAAEFACDRRSLSPACHWPHPDADTRARSLCFLPLAAASLLVSFLSHFWGWGLRKCAQGRRPSRSSSVPHALARPPGPRVAGPPLAAARRIPARSCELVLRGCHARGPCVCLKLGLNRPAGAGKENRSPHPTVPLPPFLSRLFSSF